MTKFNLIFLALLFTAPLMGPLVHASHRNLRVVEELDLYGTWHRVAVSCGEKLSMEQVTAARARGNENMALGATMTFAGGYYAVRTYPGLACSLPLIERFKIESADNQSINCKPLHTSEGDLNVDVENQLLNFISSEGPRNPDEQSHSWGKELSQAKVELSDDGILIISAPDGVRGVNHCTARQTWHTYWVPWVGL